MKNEELKSSCSGCLSSLVYLGVIILIIFLCNLGINKIADSIDGGGSSSKSSNSSRVCQFEGCTRKATNATGEFCDYHSKALNDYWDAQN